MTGGSAQEIIKVERLWRRYRRWKRRPSTLKEAFVRLLQRRGFAYEDFWALSDVSCSVRRGEIIGFCGANGSGKTTLLKIVARIVPPTHGRITVRGRIATMFDLTTGFHLELSGRENISLNGAIMGLSQGEIASRMASIVEFADIGEFIDSPVKTYSSGMYARLGFAIASHVDADILLVDEVLAVGDAEFQKKCAAWFEEIRHRKTTVMIVSHDLYMLEKLCDRVIWLDHGRIAAEGAPAAALKKYYSDFVPQTQPREETAAAAKGA